MSRSFADCRAIVLVLLLPVILAVTGWAADRQPNILLVVVDDAGYGELSADVAEQMDLAAEHPEVVGRLEKQWRRYNGEMVDPLWRTKGTVPRENWPLDLIRP